MTRAQLIYADVILRVVREIEDRYRQASIARTEKAFREWHAALNAQPSTLNPQPA